MMTTVNENVTRRVRPSRPHRLQASAALAAGALGIVLLALAVLDQPLRALLLALCTAVVLGSVASALTSRGHSRLLAIGTGATATGIGVVGTWLLSWEADTDVPRLALGVLCLAVSGGLARRSLQVPPPRDPAALAVAPLDRPVHRPVLFVNPRSGGGRATRAGVVEACGRLAIEVRVLEPGDDVRVLAERAVADGADALGMAGGDGSLGAVAEVALRHDLPFVAVPAGTRNHFALDAGLNRNDPLQALAAFTAGEEHRIDVARVNGRLFLNNVALGAYGVVVAQPGYRAAKVPTALAEVAGAVDKGHPAYALELDVPDVGHWERAALVMVSNNPYEMAPHRAMGRRRRLDGGQLGVVAVDIDGAAAVASITTLAAFAAADRSQHVWAWTTDHFEVASPHGRVPAGLDGEAIELDAPLRFDISPGALRLLVPPGTRVGFDRQEVSSGSMFTSLLDLVLTGEPPRDDDGRSGDADPETAGPPP